jgi:hypothetical protein
VKKLFRSAAIVTVILMNPVFAISDNAYYAGVGFGQSNYDLSSYTGSVDETDQVYKLLGGWLVNRWLSAELQYTDLGEAAITSGSVAQTIGFSSVGLSAMIKSPVFAQRFQGFLRLGVHRWDGSSSFETGEGSDDSGFDGLYGIGLNANIAKGWFARLEYERYATDSEVNDIDYFGGSLIYKF